MKDDLSAPCGDCGLGGACVRAGVSMCKFARVEGLCVATLRHASDPALAATASKGWIQKKAGLSDHAPCFVRFDSELGERP